MMKISGRGSRVLSFFNFSFLLSISLLFTLLSLSSSYAKNKHALQAGEKIPFIPLYDNLTNEERQYLGLHRNVFNFHKKKFFSLGEIEADYIILEFLNRYCVSCNLQVSVLNKLYYKIIENDLLRDRVKILAVGVGNNEKEIQQFRTEKKIPFPIVPDSEFDAYEAIGDPGGTPYLLILRRSHEGEFLAEARLGLIGDEEILLYGLKELVPLDLASFQTKAREHLSFEIIKSDLQTSLSEKEIKETIRQSIFQDKQELQLLWQKRDFLDHGEVYIIDSISSKSKRRWFAKVYKKSSICDVCHPVYFLLIFSEQGIVADFISLHITKYGNNHFTDRDIENLRTKIVGRDLKQTYQFNPEYDSITGATISVSIIFHSLNKISELYQKLQQEGYVDKTS